MPREYLATDSNNRMTRSSRDSETETRMPSATDPSDPSYSSRCHLADAHLLLPDIDPEKAFGFSCERSSERFGLP